jgi:hypothetical protein
MKYVIWMGRGFGDRYCQLQDENGVLIISFGTIESGVFNPIFKSLDIDDQGIIDVFKGISPPELMPNIKIKDSSVQIDFKGNYLEIEEWLFRWMQKALF